MAAVRRGSDEDIFIRFGIGPNEYFSRLIKSVKEKPCSGIDLQKLIKLARKRLHSPPEPTSM